MFNGARVALAAIGLFSAASASAAITPIELTPADLGMGASPVFTTLPTDNPTLFGFTGPNIRGIDFDFTPGGTAIDSGTSLTNQYASIGVLMNGIVVSSGVFQGPASAPNATQTPFTPGLDLIFTFTEVVVAVGTINTSPDKNIIEFWSGPNGTGTMLFTFADQAGSPSPNFFIDRFVGGRATGGDVIGSVVYTNTTGQIELDELIFEFVPREVTIPEPATLALVGAGLLGLGLRRRVNR
jgi:hypothetical protein